MYKGSWWWFSIRACFIYLNDMLLGVNLVIMRVVSFSSLFWTRKRCQQCLINKSSLVYIALMKQNDRSNLLFISFRLYFPVRESDKSAMGWQDFYLYNHVAALSCLPFPNGMIGAHEWTKRMSLDVIGNRRLICIWSLPFPSSRLQISLLPRWCPSVQIDFILQSQGLWITRVFSELDSQPRWLPPPTCTMILSPDSWTGTLAVLGFSRCNKA